MQVLGSMCLATSLPHRRHATEWYQQYGQQVELQAGNSGHSNRYRHRELHGTCASLLLPCASPQLCVPAPGRLPASLPRAPAHRQQADRCLTMQVSCSDSDKLPYQRFSRTLHINTQLCTASLSCCAEACPRQDPACIGLLGRCQHVTAPSPALRVLLPVPWPVVPLLLPSCGQLSSAHGHWGRQTAAAAGPAWGQASARGTRTRASGSGKTSVFVHLWQHSTEHLGSTARCSAV